MSDHADLTANMEDYLEAIYHIAEENPAVRAKQIARCLNVQSSSVTGALRVLGEKGMINYAPYDVITLTETGRSIAREIVRRHEVLKDFFIRILGVDFAEADAAACRMEHSVSANILDRLIRFVEFVEICPRGGNEWLNGFHHYCEQNGATENCKQSIASCLNDLKRKKADFENEGIHAITIAAATPGMRGRLMHMQGDVRRRLESRGITPGSIIEVSAPPADDGAIVVKIRGYQFCLNPVEAGQLIFKPY